MTAKPTPPPGLPEYVREGIEARTPGELRMIAAWAEELAAHEERRLQDQLEQPPEEDGEVAATHRRSVDELAAALDGAGLDDEGPDLDGATGSVYVYWIETHCNKASCSKCPHGPYPYVKFREGDTVRTRYGRSVAAALDLSPPDE